MSNKIKLFRHLYSLIKLHKKIYLQIIVGTLLYTVMGFSMSIYIQKLTDNIIPEKNTSLLTVISVIMMVLVPIQFLISVFKDYFLLKIGQIIDGKLILGYISDVLSRTDVFFENNRIGEVISRINDSVKIRNFLTNVSINIVTNISILFFSFLFMMYYYWKLAFLIFTIIPIFLIVYIISNRFNKITEKKHIETASAFREEIISSLNNIKTIKLLGLEEYTFLKIENSFISFIKAGFSSSRNNSIVQQVNVFISQFFTVLLLWIGSKYVIDNYISIGELFSFYFILNYFISPLINLVNVDVHIQNAIIAGDRMFLTYEDSNKENLEKITLTKEIIGDISFENVSFSYPNNKYVFRKLNLTIQKNQITAIIGKSGAGKSTFVLMLLRYLELEQGKIKIGEININYFSDESLKENISIVSQDVEIFYGSFIDNIHIGVKKKVDLEKIYSICKKLDLIDVIESFPDGFYSNIGEKGSKLSGGQRQRIAIARVLYRDPEIIVFDEVTSSLDNYSVSLINTIILDLKESGKTIIIIAHRLESIVGSDEIVIFDKGNIIGRGTHSELLQTNDFYVNLFLK